MILHSPPARGTEAVRCGVALRCVSDQRDSSEQRQSICWLPAAAAERRRPAVGRHQAPGGSPCRGRQPGRAASMQPAHETTQHDATRRQRQRSGAVPSFKRFVTLAGMAGSGRQGGRRQWLVNVHVLAEEGQGGAPGRRLVPDMVGRVRRLLSVSAHQVNSKLQATPLVLSLTANKSLYIMMIYLVRTYLLLHGIL